MTWTKMRHLLTFSAVLAALAIVVLWFCKTIIVGLLGSFFLAYLLAPVLAFIEGHSRFKRKTSVLAILLVCLTVFGLSTAWLVPLIYRESVGILRQVPQAMDFLATKIEPIKQTLANSGFVTLPRLEDFLASFDIWENISLRSRSALGRLIDTTPDLLSAVLNAGLIPILLYFILVDLPKIRFKARKLVPPNMRAPIMVLVHRVDLTFKSVLKGQVIVAGILSIMYMVGLSLIQLQSGLAIGFIAGLFRLIPYMDVVVGLSLSLIVIVTTGGGLSSLILVAAVFITVQVLDAMVITPRVIGDRAGLHPGVVIVSVICFGNRFGFWGVLLAIPAVAILKVFSEYALSLYEQSPIYRD